MVWFAIGVKTCLSWVCAATVSLMSWITTCVANAGVECGSPFNLTAAGFLADTSLISLLDCSKRVVLAKALLGSEVGVDGSDSLHWLDSLETARRARHAETGGSMRKLDKHM